jgi:phosphate transport system permease protein
MSQNNHVDASPVYPEGDDLQSFIKRRNRSGLAWRVVFQAATIVAIIALTALLYNIIIGSFGYVALQNKVDPASLVLAAEEGWMLDAANTISSEDDMELVKGIKDNPDAIGFFGYAYYQDNADALTLLAVDGVSPAAQTVATGQYPMTRPLYLYAAAETLADKPQMAAFVNFYLSSVNDEIGDVGYFPAGTEAMAQSKQNWLTATGQVTMPRVNPETFSPEDGLTITGSSTVYPLTREMAKLFRQAGFSGPFKLDSVGTSAGLAQLCGGNGVDLVNASRAINRAEVEACEKAGLTPLEFRVGTDALAIAVSSDNNFLTNVTRDELRRIFTTAQTWAEVNPAWPNQPIERYIPGGDSGTLDFFAETTFNRSLTDLPAETYISILEANLSKGLLRRYESEMPLAERSTEDLYDLVLERVVEQRVVKSWSLVDSLLHKAEIDAFVATVPQGELQFRSWLHWDFLSSAQSSTPELAGIRTAIFGSLWVIFITILVALPLGVGASIYLEEYAAHVNSRFLRQFNGFIQTNINNLAGVPSIIYGMLGLAIFVRGLEPLTSGALFGVVDQTTANGRTIVSAGLTLALLILPLIIINAQEAIRAVPQSLRQAGMGLGATKWQTIWHHVLPNALPGILTGNILAMSRAIGETAPLVVIGASTFITVDPSSPFAKFTTLPIQIYQWTARPQDEFRNIAAAAIIVLLILLLTLNASAVLLRNRFSKRLV